MRILIAEDEVGIARGLQVLLEKHHFCADTVFNGLDALDSALHNGYDVIILDIMMPGMDGLSVLHRIRQKGLCVPVMLLTARGEINDRVTGLNEGADDYLPKPFAPAELVARVTALARRSTAYMDRTLSCGNITLDRSCYLLCHGEEQIRLNNKEYQLMELFLQHPRFVFSAGQLMDRVWSQDSEAAPDVVWTYIGFLRKKLRQLNADIEIKTVRGAGYSLESVPC